MEMKIVACRVGVKGFIVKRKQENVWGNEVLYSLTGVVVMWIYIFTKTCRTVVLKSMLFKVQNYTSIKKYPIDTIIYYTNSTS